MEPVKIFIDTNIVLDYFSGRMSDGYAKTIVQIGQDHCFELCISILTAINVLYVSRKYSSSLRPADISRLFRILHQDYQQYCDAQDLHHEDFEDALQVSCAVKNNCKVLISRDSHLLGSDLHSISIMAPEEFIRQVRA